MTVKVIYLNGCWEYVRNICSIRCSNAYYFLESANGDTYEFDSRLKLEITSY